MTITFRPSSPGAAAIAHGIRRHGTLEGWRERFRRAPPLVQLAMLASASSCLLHPVGASEGFVVDLAGATSRGKTVALLAAASAWGDPRSLLVGSWEATKVAIMERAAVLHSIPVLLDDTKHAKNDPEKISEVLYAVPAGRERERGRKDGGSREVRRWLTCLISTGESRITAFTNDAGARARTLSFFASPFDEPAQAVAYAAGLSEHYGHAGMHLVDWVRAQGFATVKARHGVLYDRIAAGHTAPATLRLMKAVALLDLAAEGLGFPEGDTAAALALAEQAAVDAANSADVHRIAFETLTSWCAANAGRFSGGERHEQEPHSGWLGVLEPDGGGFAILCPQAKEVLERSGYDANECLSVWAERGWIETTPKDIRRRRRLRGRYVWTYVLLSE